MRLIEESIKQVDGMAEGIKQPDIVKKKTKFANPKFKS